MKIIFTVVREERIFVYPEINYESGRVWKWLYSV